MVPSRSDADQVALIWGSADKLRGSMDAAQHKDFVLGLVFLKLASDAFEARRRQIREELTAEGVPEARHEEFLDDEDEYKLEGLFWMPESARWAELAMQANSSAIGELINGAMDAVMRANPSLAGVLPKIFNRDNVDQRRLSELVRLISDVRFAGYDTKSGSDVLGEVYERFLEKAARAEGKRGGEFYTPSCVVKVLVEILEPCEGRVYDPCCGSGGMLVQAQKFVLNHGGRRCDIAVYGQEANERNWRLAKMNLAIHGINGNLSTRWADTFHDDKYPDLKADYVMANPPFNMSDWYRKIDDTRWRFGTPPARNANFAWIQHIISKLSARGNAGIVMGNGSMSSKQSGEGEIRAALVEADLVSCVIALPTRLFHTTQIPASLWCFAKDKSARGGYTSRQGQVLFIDARAMGATPDRRLRILTDEDIAKIAITYHAWRGTGSARDAHLTYADEPSFCYSAARDEIREHAYILAPARYVSSPVNEETAEAKLINDRISRLTQELLTSLNQADRIEEEIRVRLMNEASD